jgi:hypothetical protein
MSLCDDLCDMSIIGTQSPTNILRQKYNQLTLSFSNITCNKLNDKTSLSPNTTSPKVVTKKLVKKCLLSSDILDHIGKFTTTEVFIRFRQIDRYRYNKTKEEWNARFACISWNIIAGYNVINDLRVQVEWAHICIGRTTSYERSMGIPEDFDGHKVVTKGLGGAMLLALTKEVSTVKVKFDVRSKPYPISILAYESRVKDSFNTVYAVADIQIGRLTM